MSQHRAKKLHRRRWKAALALALSLIMLAAVSFGYDEVREQQDDRDQAAYDTYAEAVTEEDLLAEEETEDGQEEDAEEALEPDASEFPDVNGEDPAQMETPGEEPAGEEDAQSDQDVTTTPAQGETAEQPDTAQQTQPAAPEQTQQNASDRQQTETEQAAQVPTAPVRKPRKIKKRVDTRRTDSDNDAAPKGLKLSVSPKDRAAVLSVPNSPVDASEVSGSRARQAGKYRLQLKQQYHVEIAPDFALIMEEIENAFELKHGLISQEAYDLSQAGLDKGVVFGLDESSAQAKSVKEGEMLVYSEEEVDLLTAAREDPLNAPTAADDAKIAAYHYGNWADILAIYILRQRQAGADIVKLDEDAAPALTQLFEDMNRVVITNQPYLVASFTNLTVEDYIREKESSGNADEKLAEQLADYTSSGFLLLAAAESGSRQLTLAAYDALQQEDETQAVSSERKAVVLAAQTLNGKIHYFWGGKYNHTGWNKAWATMKIVCSKGSSSTGTAQIYGLDCSGFVSWAFINGTGSELTDRLLGQGTASQWATSEPVSDEDAKVGDLVFLRAPSSGGINHVGILIGRDADGNWMAIHCNAGDDNVAIDRAYDAGFRYIRRPLLYTD